MAANNTILVIGRAGRDPEIRQAGASQVAKFSVAVDRPIKDKQGNKVTDWFNVETWGKSAELAARLITKGQMLSVAGALHIDKGNDGKQYVTLKADGFQLIGGRDERTGNAESAADELARVRQAQTDADANYGDDEIPPF